MALASLFARRREAFDNKSPNFLTHARRRHQGSINRPPDHAFIVDHKVRPESTEEAKWVAEQCRSKREYCIMPDS